MASPSLTTTHICCTCANKAWQLAWVGRSKVIRVALLVLLQVMLPFRMVTSLASLKHQVTLTCFLDGTEGLHLSIL